MVCGFYDDISSTLTWSPKKVYLTSTLYSEMVGVLGFPVCLDLYSSFDSLLICFHDLMNRWQ